MRPPANGDRVPRLAGAEPGSARFPSGEEDLAGGALTPALHAPGPPALTGTMVTATTRPRLVLASGSPRRREVLAGLGVAFELRPMDLDETPAAGRAGAATTCCAWREEKAAGAPPRPGELVLAADTTVVLGGETVGKPADPADARAVLRKIAGRRAHRPHRRRPRRARPRPAGGRPWCSSRVTMAELTDERDRLVRRHRRAAGQGRLLRHSGPRRAVRRGGGRQLHQRRRPAGAGGLPAVRRAGLRPARFPGRRRVTMKEIDRDARDRPGTAEVRRATGRHRPVARPDPRLPRAGRPLPRRVRGEDPLRRRPARRRPALVARHIRAATASATCSSTSRETSPSGSVASIGGEPFVRHRDERVRRRPHRRRRRAAGRARRSRPPRPGHPARPRRRPTSPAPSRSRATEPTSSAPPSTPSST